MKVRSTVKTALRALAANKTRTVLTILGMFIGITSVMIVFSAGEGVKGLILGQVELFGTDIIETEVKVPTGKKGSEAESQSAAAMMQGVQVTTLKLEDMEDLVKISNVTDGYGAIIGQELASYGNETKKAMLFGVSASYIDIDSSEIDYGRFYGEEEDRSQAQVIVLGSKLKQDLFGESDPLGKMVKIKKSKFRVIGVLKEKGAVFTFNFDDMIYLPVRTLQKRIMGVDHIIYMVHRLKDMELADETAEEARIMLRENHGLKNTLKAADAPMAIGEGPTDISQDDFRVVTMQESMEVMNTITDAITLLLLAIVAISLVVGGVGIMNVLYVVVSERTMEIGLRKAVGATYRDIMYQILIESILITSLACLVGIVIGLLVSYALSRIASSYGLDWKFSVPIQAFITAAGFSLFFGIIFGLFPARKAARMQPIDALRKE